MLFATVLLFSIICLGSRAAIKIRFHCLIFLVGDAGQLGHPCVCLTPLLVILKRDDVRRTSTPNRRVCNEE